MICLILVSCDSSLPRSFGDAYRFHPLPDIAVGAHCPWKVVLNEAQDRIPPVVTEILCLRPNHPCGGNINFEV